MPRMLVESLPELLKRLPEMAEGPASNGKWFVLKAFPQCLPVPSGVYNDNEFPLTLIPDVFWRHLGEVRFRPVRSQGPVRGRKMLGPFECVPGKVRRGAGSAAPAHRPWGSEAGLSAVQRKRGNSPAWNESSHEVRMRRIGIQSGICRGRGQVLQLRPLALHARSIARKPSQAVEPSLRVVRRSGG